MKKIKAVSKPFYSKDLFLKQYHPQSLESLDPTHHDLHDLISYFSELFTSDSHEPENFKKCLLDPQESVSIPSSIVSSPKFKHKFYGEKTTLYSPFETTGLTHNKLDEKVWFYLDEEHHISGPHSTKDMDMWFNHGDLHGSTKVAYNQKEKFCKIYKFMEIFKEFEIKKNVTEIDNNKKDDGPKFKKFGFVNQHKSAENSPTLKKNPLAEDEIVETNDAKNGEKNYKEKNKNEKDGNFKKKKNYDDDYNHNYSGNNHNNEWKNKQKPYKNNKNHTKQYVEYKVKEENPVKDEKK